MALDLNQLAADDAAYAKQAQAAAAQAPQPKDPKQPPSFLDQFKAPISRVSTTMIDAATHAADMWGRFQQDLGAGELTAGANIADAAHSFVSSGVRNLKDSLTANPKDQAVEEAISNDSEAGADRMRSLHEVPSSPIWDHAKQSILDFRDAVAVKDPTLADSLTQGVAQLAIPFAGYSRLLAGVHGLSSAVAAGGLTDVTALQPHDMRMADLISQGRQTEGKLGEVLHQIAPDGSAMNAYINYLTDRTNETEAQGRFKNALDGLTTNLLVTPLLHAAGITLKQGAAGTRYLVENGVRNTLSDLAGPMKNPRELQEGKIVFHGTGSGDFDEFDNSKIGSGEGNQSFGHGHYFAENPATGKYYRDALERRNVPAGSPMDTALTAVRQAGGSNRQAYESLIAKAAKARDMEVRDQALKAADLVRSGNASPRGKLMHVDIPDEHISSMIDWDRPISTQPNLQKALGDLKVTVEPENGRFRVKVNGKPGPLYLTRAAAMSETDLLRGEGPDVNAGMAYNQLAEAMRSPRAASEHLNSVGIPGITYLDQGSRASGKGTRNIVLFDPKLAKIVKKE